MLMTALRKPMKTGSRWVSMLALRIPTQRKDAARDALMQRPTTTPVMVDDRPG